LFGGVAAVTSRMEIPLCEMKVCPLRQCQIRTLRKRKRVQEERCATDRLLVNDSGLRTLEPAKGVL